jgi:hypothetical protein
MRVVAVVVMMMMNMITTMPPVCPAAFDLFIFAADGAQHPTPAPLKSDQKQIEQSPSIITHHQKNVE